MARILVLFALAALASVIPCVAQAAWKESIIYNFQGGNDGAAPWALSAGEGGLYGVTNGGGAAQLGTIYLLAPPTSPGGGWTLKTLSDFAGTGIGGPIGGLLAEPGEIFFGLAGAAFQFNLTPSPQVTVLYALTGPDGEFPQGSLISDKSGNLYGVTEGGGPNNWGEVFEVSPPATSGGEWTMTILHAFTGGSDGGQPEAGLMMAGSGSLYGTAAYGGIVANTPGGVVFRLDPPAEGGASWTETVLYSFKGQGDGKAPHARLIMDHAGNLYGTTEAGGTGRFGTAFRLTPPTAGTGQWSETILHNFTGGADGSSPLAGVSWGNSSVLYGTAPYNGQAAINCGIVYSLTPSSGSQPWTETILHAFQGTKGGDGCAPSAEVLITPSGALFSTTGAGGTANVGTVFELQP